MTFIRFLLIIVVLTAMLSLSYSQQNNRRQQAKSEKLKKLVTNLEKQTIPSSFTRDSWSQAHNPKGPAVFAAALMASLRKQYAHNFVGTLRNTGYAGDIVFAVSPDGTPEYMDALKKYQVISYTTQPDCTGEGNAKVCQFQGQQERFSINMIRYYLYQWWAMQYDSEALIMIADFRDVFFQKNPFTFHPTDWSPPNYQLAVFQEPYPNKVIYRCPFNGMWIKGCYGADGLQKIGSNTVSCSGVSMGTRDAILAYSFLLVQQLDPRIRYGRSTNVTDNHGCMFKGMDQGFHNWLVYSGQLDKYMDVKIFQQGEGPVNTVGAYSSGGALLKFSLKEWKVLRGEAPNQYFYNWNGEISPAVHQYDRFLNSDLGNDYKKSLAAMSAIKE